MRSPNALPARVRRRRLAATACGVLAASLLLPGPVASAANSQTVTVTAAQAIYPVDEGGRVTIALVVSTSDGRPLAEPATVSYATGKGTATAGTDYRAVSDTVAFDKGSTPGTKRQITVTVSTDGTAEGAETIPVSLHSSTSGVTVPTPPTVVINANGLPYLDSRLPIARRVADLMGRMSLEDKIGQMTQAERGAVAPDPSVIAGLRLGSLLSGGGSVPTPNTAAAWIDMVNNFQRYALSTPLQIPMIYGIDAVHGHGNVKGATIFPHNIGLGSTRDPALTEDVYHATAAEVRATGIPWDFAPCVCVSRDERWGRSYESFGEDPALVGQMETAVDGLQGRPGQLADPDRVLATVKHYAGDGDTEYGSSTTRDYTIDQGVTVTNRADFNRIDLPPYSAAVRQHAAGSVMPSYSSIDWTEDGVGNPVKMHAHRELITDVLKKQIGFDGFVISDWEAIHQIPDPDAAAGATTPTAGQVRAAVNAGTDMFMEPVTAARFEQLLRAEVTARRVTTSRIDDAVRRILRSKFQLGLFERPFASPDRAAQVGSSAHRAIARKAVAESQVLLKNSGNLLPLRPDAKVYVAGRNADDIGNQSGGWTLDWEGRSGPGVTGTTILQGIRQVAPGAKVTYSADGSAPTTGSDVGVVVVGETPYAEGYGDVGGPSWTGGTPQQREKKSLTLQPGDRAVVDKVCAAVAKCVVLVVSGRPQVLTDQLGGIDALVASWLPGSEGAGVADVLFGRQPFTGRLSVTWPRTVKQVPINVGDAAYLPLYPFGWGLRTDPDRNRLATGATAATGATGATGDTAQARSLLGPTAWGADGALRTDPTTLARVNRALQQAPRKNAVSDAILAAVRDAAQASVVAGRAPANWAALIANADQADLQGNPLRAFVSLQRVIRP